MSLLVLIPDNKTLGQSYHSLAIQVTYPVREYLDRKYLQTCENEEMKKRHGGFYIHKLQPKPSDYKWIAVLNPSTTEPVLGYLDAEKGQCDNLRTNPGNRRCGIGNALMMLCLKDEDITDDGGLNPLTDPEWLDDDLKEPTRNLCEAIILVSCSPYEGTPPKTCEMYMNAAKIAGHHMIFTGKNIGIDIDKKRKKRQSNGDEKYQVFEIANAKQIFEADPEKFLLDHGKFWFFCKCRKDRMADCLGNVIYQNKMFHK